MFLVDNELDKAASKASRDQRHCHLKEGRGEAASFIPLRSNGLSPSGLGKLFIPSLSEAIIVTQSSEAVASEASPSYEGTFWGMSSRELGV